MANESTCIFCYLRDRSLFIAEGGWEKILGGITWFLGEQKGGSVVTENPKGGITDSEGGTTQIFLENEDMEGGRGGREKHQKLFGGPDHFSEVTFKGEIG